MRFRSVLACVAACGLVFVACGGSSFTAGSNGGAGVAGLGAGGSAQAGAAQAGGLGAGSSSVAGSSIGGSSGASTGGSNAGGSNAGGMSAGGASGGGTGTAGASAGMGGAPAVCTNAVKDCPVPSTTCQTAACNATSHSCITVDVALGTACKDNGGVVCSGMGQCVATHCADGVLDADETDIDCGGSCGATCKAAGPQQRCKVAGDCASGSCSSTTLLCQPGCAATCTALCNSCLIPGKVDTCSPLPDGVDDTKNVCTGQAVCDAMASCVASAGKGHFGDACTVGTDCFNGTCAAGLCKLKNGDACGEDAACMSGRCAAHVCAACASDDGCATAVCTAGVCGLPGGASCAVAADCASTMCSAGKFCIQQSSSNCVAQTCFTHACISGLCQTCMTAADCPMGTPCTGGTCLAPTGAYCTSGATCASGTCLPAALLSLRKCQ